MLAAQASLVDPLNLPYKQQVRSRVMGQLAEPVVPAAGGATPAAADGTPSPTFAQQPAAPSAAAAPMVGDVKTFPNGNVGKWDGRGWVHQRV